ncbi:MAG: translation initiation factor IF-2, partial [Firmicutes bacterium]|nr:translation initiation factor IF-2 [Bacillota bacterium]
KKDARPEAQKQQTSKRTLIRRGLIIEDNNEDRGVYRKARKRKETVKETAQKVEYAVITTENLTVKILSEKIGAPAQDIIKQLMVLGIMTTINSVVDFPTMELVADALGVKIELKLDKTKEEQLTAAHDEVGDEANLSTRPPIVTVMGHVDHGKTSLLDRIKQTNVAEGEAGGITQHIGAYTVKIDGREITFIDTPGHEAFTAMRARGARVTDIAIIVVAADDGIMPQTVEAINHARAAKVPMVIAANKADKPAANVDRIRQQLTEHDVIVEEWGGEVPLEAVSAKTGAGIDKLLRSVLAVAEVADLSANPDRKAKGTIIEARLDKGKGAIATLIVQNGTLRTGDTVVSGFAYGRVRAMYDDKGVSVKEAGPSYAISVVGFQEVPSAGDNFYVVDEKLARQVADERETKKRESLITQIVRRDIDELMQNAEKVKELNLIVKADVQGSVEALKSSIAKLATNEVRICVIHAAVGAISQSDVNLAVTAKAEILGFNVRPDNEIKTLAEHNNVKIKLYRIIYEALEDIEKSIKGLTAPVLTEKVIGHAEVRAVYKITGVGAIAGCYVTDGKAQRNAKVRILRDSVIVYESTVDSLKRFKDDAKEVASGFECGVGVVNYNDIKEKDVIEFYIIETDK